MVYRESQDIIISTVLFDSGCDYEYFLENVQPHFFEVNKYTKVYEVVKDLTSRAISITPEILKINLGDGFHTDYLDLVSLQGEMTSSLWKEAIRVLKIQYAKKSMISVMKEELAKIEGEASNVDLEAAVSLITQRLGEIEFSREIAMHKLSDNVEDYLEYISDLKDGLIEKGLMTGFPSLDEVTNGLTGNQLIVLGAYESVGKSSFALNIINNLLHQDKSCLMFSLEMNEKQLINRLVSMETKINMEKLKNDDKLTDGEFKMIGEAVTFIKEKNFYVNTDMDISVDKIMQYAIQIKRKHGLDFIVIDHLHLLGNNERGNGKDEREKINYISRSLKKLTKILNIPVLVLAQLNRDGTDPYCLKVPSRKRLRESGSIEADADIVMMLHRLLNKPDGTPSDRSVQEEAYVLFDKHRDGAKKMVKIRFDLATQRFIDLKKAVPTTDIAKLIQEEFNI